MISFLPISHTAVFFADFPTPEASQGVSWDTIALFILGLTTAIALIIALITPLADARDRLVETGFCSKDGWLGRQMLQRRELVLKKLLEQIGFTEQHRSFVRDAYARNQAADQVKAIDTPRLIEHLLTAMRGCIIVNSIDLEFRPATGKYNVDVMGAVSALSPNDWDFAIILAKWLHLLTKESVIPHFDAILTPKNGNPTLIHRAADFYSPSLSPMVLTWKSRDDHSRVARENRDIPHFLDFEGLWAYQRKRRSDKHLKVIAVDDNFTSAETLTDAIDQFNKHLQSQKDDQFDPIETAVALFALKTDQAERNFQKISKTFQVHTMLSLGIPELAKLASQVPIPELMKDLCNFQDGFTCKEASKLSNIEKRKVL
jgi:hypothetical protein